MESRKSLVDLQEAYHAKKAPLQLCDWRLERRAARPEREKKRDNFEVALDTEKEVLDDAQKKLAVSIKKTDQMIQSLVKTHEILKHDLQVKSKAMAIDQDCIQAAHSWGTMTRHAPLEAASEENSSLPVAILYSNRHEEQEHRRQYDTVNRVKAAKKQEMAAEALRAESVKVMQATSSACNAAQLKVQRTMQDNIDELQTMRKRLQHAIEQSNQKINQTNSTLRQTAAEISSHNAPCNLASTRLKLRGQRPERENISDPVRDALDQQMASLQKNMESLDVRHNHEKDALQKLAAEKSSLEADLTDKMKALYIDLECQKKSLPGLSSYQSPADTKKAMTRTLNSLGASYPITQALGAKSGAMKSPSAPRSGFGASGTRCLSAR
jgi:tektin-3